MPVQISDFFPKMMPLFKKPEGVSEDWKAPVPGMEDVWVRVVPPTWEIDRRRQSYVKQQNSDERTSFLDIFHFEIFLTYGGTNMVVIVPRKDENGKLVYKPDSEYGCETEVVQFDEFGKLTIEEFSQRMNKLPMSIVDYWHSRVLEVALQWQPRFR
jgi:hypothetical protein